MGMKRGRLEIIYDILSAIKSKGGTIRPTKLLYKSNLSHKMMLEYLADLKKKNLVAEDEILEKKKTTKVYTLTTKGYEYLKEYKQVINFIESFDLNDDE